MSVLPRATRTRVAVLALLALPALWPAARLAAQSADLADQVEIRRTAYGVPHLLADNLRAAGFALGYVQAEDYGERVIMTLLRARGEMGRTFGPDSMDSDFRNRWARARAVETYHLLSQDVRDVFEGFAAGVNRYIDVHRAELPDWVEPIFNGHDVAARDVGFPSGGGVQRFLRRLREERTTAAAQAEPEDEDGSNAWAFAPSRTRSGRAILLRNPHLSWTAGYYEAHVTVPGVLNFYGDFRIGGPFTIIGGFNEHLGWSTTNNSPDTDEIYALEVDPARPDHYLFDGGSVPLHRESVTVEFRNGDGFGTETRDFWFTPLGPVIHRADGRIYIYRGAGAGEYRVGEQFLRMMRARSLEEWKEGMRIRARTSSNYTYADRRGNIFYVWNGAVPALPHPSGGDTAAVPASRSSEVWTRLVPFDSLPQLLNPRGGYLHNENDPFHFTNLNQPLRAEDFPDSYPEPRLRLRSQHALELVHGNRKLSLEDVIRMKHSMRMLLADRVKDELVAAVRATQPVGDVAAAIDLIERWDNTVAAESRGGVLFEMWYRRYVSRVEGEPFREPWTADAPMATPRGLADPAAAADAFAWAVAETGRRHGAWDVAWGDVHRVRRGGVDVPVGGCSGALGCFRVLNFRQDEDGKRVVTGGDGWVLAVEFTDPPRALSVLGYGQSNREDSPHFSDQAELFAGNRMKEVAFTEEQIRRQLVRSYRPGR